MPRRSSAGAWSPRSTPWCKGRSPLDRRPQADSRGRQGGGQRNLPRSGSFIDGLVRPGIHYSADQRAHAQCGQEGIGRSIAELVGGSGLRVAGDIGSGKGQTSPEPDSAVDRVLKLDSTDGGGCEAPLAVPGLHRRPGHQPSSVAPCFTLLSGRTTPACRQRGMCKRAGIRLRPRELRCAGRLPPGSPSTRQWHNRRGSRYAEEASCPYPAGRHSGSR